MKALSLLMSLAVLLSLPSFFSRANAYPSVRVQEKSASQGEPAQSKKVVKTLAQMGAGAEPLKLLGAKAFYGLKVPISPREVLKSAKLVLTLTNSTALIKSRSALTLRLNGHVLAQYQLDPQDTQKVLAFNLPSEVLKPGYNELLLEAVQHYTYECEDAGSPELWTEVNPQTSYLEMDFYGVKPNFEPRLSQLHIAFDKRAWLSRGLSIVTGTEQVSSAQLRAASLVTQGLALRQGYRPLNVELHSASTGSSSAPRSGQLPQLSSQVVSGRDVLLVGLRSELSRYLDSDLYRMTEVGPFVGVLSADEGKSVVLVVTGSTEEELMTAARSVAEPDFKFSDVTMEVIKKRSAFPVEFLAVPGKKIPFSKFDFRTTEARGQKPQSASFEFRAPADYGAKKGDLATLKLHFSHGAGLRPDSSMVIRLNGEFAAAVPLKDPSGNEFERFEVSLPAQFVRPGFNTLSFEPVFVPHTERCESPRDAGLVLTLYEDSTLTLPSPTVAPVAPDLQRFSQGLWPASEGVSLYVNDRSIQSSSAAVSLSALMAQKNRGPMDFDVGFEPPKSGHVLMVGTYGAIPQEWLKSVPLARYAWSAEGAHVGVLQNVMDKRILTSFIASQPQALKTAMQMMGELGFWTEMKGEAAIVDIRDKTIVTEVAKNPEKFGSFEKYSVVLGDWQKVVFMALAGAVLFAVGMVGALRRLAKRRKIIN